MVPGYSETRRTAGGRRESIQATKSVPEYSISRLEPGSGAGFLQSRQLDFRVLLQVVTLSDSEVLLVLHCQAAIDHERDPGYK